MASIVASTEISRNPDDVFAYVTDPSRLPELQESVVKAESGTLTLAQPSSRGLGMVGFGRASVQRCRLFGNVA
jgi:hypothetical protein